MLEERNHDKLAFFILSWYADFPDPQNFLSNLLTTNGAGNHYGYSDPEVDKLCDAADVDDDAVHGGVGEQFVILEVVGLLLTESPVFALVASVVGIRPELGLHSQHRSNKVDGVAPPCCSRLKCRVAVMADGCFDFRENLVLEFCII